MDDGTCEACARLDGTVYASFEELFADYRPDGGCLWCAGGLRCRGAWVVVWADETPATVQEPYEQTPPPEPPVPVPSTPTEPAPTAPLVPAGPPGGGGTPPRPPRSAPEPGDYPWSDPVSYSEAVRRDFTMVFERATSEQGLRIRATVDAADTASPLRRRVVVTGADRDGTEVLRASRTIDLETGIVRHNVLHVNDAYQRRGIGTIAHNESVALYRRQRMRAITMQANKDVGGYTWARLGFDWDMTHPESATGLARFIRDRCADMQLLGPTATEAAQIDRILAATAKAETEGTPFPAPFEIAMIGAHPDAKMWIGKQVMLGRGWPAVLDLRSAR